MAYTLNENLKRWAEQYETADFINADPVQIPHRYDGRVNIEISAFVTAWIAWGNRKQIIKKADFIDREIFKGEPYHYIMGTDYGYKKQDWNQYKGDKTNFYRTFTYADFHDLWKSREAARKNAAKDNQRLKNHVIDQLHADGLLDAGNFAVLFAKVLDKVATGYSSNDREFIRAVGMTAFNITMQKLIADEKERDNSDGNN